MIRNLILILDFSQYRAKISPTSPGLASPVVLDKKKVAGFLVLVHNRRHVNGHVTEDLICWYKSWKESQQTSVNLYWRNSRWKLNPKSKNIQADASCTKLVVLFSPVYSIITFKVYFIWKAPYHVIKKQGDINFAFESTEGDFSRYRAWILPTLPGLVSPGIVFCPLRLDWWAPGIGKYKYMLYYCTIMATESVCSL
jgi:hypothetical protein